MTTALSHGKHGNATAIGVGSVVGFILVTAAILVGRELYQSRHGIGLWIAELTGELTACERDDWKPFVSDAGNFSVSMPCTGAPVPLEGDDPLPGYRYQVKSQDADVYGVVYVDLSRVAGNPVFELDVDRFLWEARKFVIAESESELLKKLPLSLLEHYPGREYWSRQPSGRTSFWRIYYVEPMLYVVEAMTGQEDRPLARHERFLASFELLEDPLAGVRREEETEKRAVKTLDQQSFEEIMAKRAREDAARRERVREQEQARLERNKEAAEAFRRRQKSTEWHKQ